ncbi:MAG: hypothetical protein ACOC7X_13840 [Spirochaetota bacterium]
MSCNAVDLQNVYFWLVLAAGGLGGTIGALLTAGWRSMKMQYGWRGGLLTRGERRRSPRQRPGAGLIVKCSLLLSLAVLAVLGAIVFLDLPQVEWNRFLLYFFLFTVLGWTVVYIGFRWLVIPLVLVAVLYIMFVTGVVRQWGCCQPGDQLLEISVIAQQAAGAETVTKVELHGPEDEQTEFREIDGDALRVVLSTIRFEPWVFYPRCAFLFRVHSVSGLAEPSGEDVSASGLEEAGLPLEFLLKAGIAELELLEVVQPELQVLRTYLLVTEGSVPEFRTQR